VASDPARQRSGLFWVGVVMAAFLVSITHASADDSPECTIGQARKIHQGFRSIPVPLDLSQTGSRQVGLGSYLVHVQGGCNNCHTKPPYTEGGNPFLGQPPVVNADGYLAGGMAFGPFIARNITPCQDGKPAGLT
jgi:hypothetical protein